MTDPDAPRFRPRTRPPGRRLLPWVGCARRCRRPVPPPLSVDPVHSTDLQPKERAPDEPTFEIVDEEERLLTRVRAHLATVRPSLPPPTADYEGELLSLRDRIAAARLEDVPALVQQMERLSGIAARRAENVVEPVDPRSPYFGHLRLREKGRGERDVLIGKTTHVDGKAGVRIVDWRHAPVSRDLLPLRRGRRIRGDVRRARGRGQGAGAAHGDHRRRRAPAHLGPRGDVRAGEAGWKTLGVQATELSGGQGSAMRPEDMKGALGVGASFAAREDRHLPEIAALLDPRQFDLISRPDSGIVVIQGGAGSGKTTIGIHRMAFLNFNARQRFVADKMLIVVGSPALRAYIGEILPALGLRGVVVETFREWAAGVRQRAFPWLDAPLEENTPTVVTRYKTHPVMLRLLAERAAAYTADPRARKDSHGVLHFWADLLTDLDGVPRRLRQEPRSRARRRSDQARLALVRRPLPGGPRPRSRRPRRAQGRRPRSPPTTRTGWAPTPRPSAPTIARRSTPRTTRCWCAPTSSSAASSGEASSRSCTSTSSSTRRRISPPSISPACSTSSPSTRSRTPPCRCPR